MTLLTPLCAAARARTTETLWCFARFTYNPSPEGLPSWKGELWIRMARSGLVLLQREDALLHWCSQQGERLKADASCSSGAHLDAGISSVVSSERLVLVKTQQDSSSKGLPQPAAQHHVDTRQTGMGKRFPSLTVAFQIICSDRVHMSSIHQHLYAVSYNSHLLVFNECLFTEAFSRERAWCAEPAHIPAASNTV